MTIRDDKIVNHILENGGITLDTTTMQTITATTGFMVSIAGKEEKHSMRNFIHSGKVFLDAYIEKHRFELMRDDIYLGCWVDGDSVYFDLSERFEKALEAIGAGHEREQLAIYDLENDYVVEL